MTKDKVVTYVMGKPVTTANIAPADYYKTSQAQVSVPYKPPAWIDTISQIAQIGADVYKTVTAVKYAETQAAIPATYIKIDTPTQVVKNPGINDQPQREVEKAQPQAQLPILAKIQDIIGSFMPVSTAEAPVVTRQAGTNENTTIQKNQLIIAGIVIVLIIILVWQRRS